MVKKLTRLLKTNLFFEPILFLVDLILFITDFLATFSSRYYDKNKIVLIKVDKLGDYIVFRNFINEIKISDQYKNYSITLILSSELKPFAEVLDKNEVSDIIYIDIYRYSSNIYYRYKLSKYIYKQNFEVSIAPTYSRVLVLDDFISFQTRANTRIGSIAHHLNIKTWEKWWGNKLYTQIIDTKSDFKFEFIRNKHFFEQVLSKKLHTNLSIQICKEEAKDSYFIFIPGAGDTFRQWKPENFAKLADFLVDKHGLKIILCGAPSEISIGDEIVSKVKNHNKIYNYIGKKSIIELLQLISNAKYIISNETGTVHLAAALNKKVYVLSNGNHFVRWTEYPKEMEKNIIHIYPFETPHYESKNHIDLGHKFDKKSNINIDEITVEKVYNIVSI